MDFIPVSPFVIKEWRGLSDPTYEKFVEESNGWTIEEISEMTIPQVQLYFKAMSRRKEKEQPKVSEIKVNRSKIG